MTLLSSQTKCLFLLLLFLLLQSCVECKRSQKASSPSSSAITSINPHCGKSFLQWFFRLQPLHQKLKTAKERLNAHLESIKRRNEERRGEERGGKGWKAYKRKLKAEQSRVALLNHYIALLQSAILAKENTVQATAEYLQQNPMTNAENNSDSNSNSISSNDMTPTQQESLRLLRQMEQAKEDEAAARKEVAAMEDNL